MIDLIILDLYGTLIIADKYDDTPRKGIRRFVRKNSDKKIVLATDDPFKDYIENILEKQGILGHFEGIYTGDDLIEIKNYLGKRKDLKKICYDFNLTSDKAIFISDGDKDRLDAKREGVKFVHVPKYRFTNEKFSFEMIDLDKNLPRYRDLRGINYQYVLS